MAVRRTSAKADAGSIWRRATTLAADAEKLVAKCNEEGLSDYDPDFMNPRIVGRLSVDLAELLEKARGLEVAAEDVCGALEPDAAE